MRRRLTLPPPVPACHRSSSVLSGVACAALIGAAAPGAAAVVTTVVAHVALASTTPSRPLRCRADVEGKGGRTQPSPASSRAPAARVAVGAHARSLLQADGLEASRGALRNVDAEEGADERGWCDVALVVATSGGAPRAAAYCDGVLHTACAGAAYAGQIGGGCDGPLVLGERIAIFGRAAGSLCDLQVRVESV